MLTKVHIVKAMIFPVVMYRCESWAIEKAEVWRNDAFKLWCWRRLLRVPWTARRSNQSVLKEINPEYSLEGLMLKLKLQYFGHWCKDLTHWKRPWSWERLRAGGDRSDRGWDGWMASLTQWTWVWASSVIWWRTGEPGVLQSMGLQRMEHNLETEQQNSYSVFYFIRNWKTIFQVFALHQHCLSVLVALYLHQHLVIDIVFSFCLFAFQIGM